MKIIGKLYSEIRNNEEFVEKSKLFYYFKVDRIFF